MEFIEYVKIFYNGCEHYNCENSSSLGMSILGWFLIEDVTRDFCRSNKWPTYKEWALDDSLGDCLTTNLTCLEKEGDYIFLTDIYSDEEVPTEFKISRQQFVKLFDDWQEKVCKAKPKEIVIKYENDEFVFETKN